MEIIPVTARLSFVSEPGSQSTQSAPQVAVEVVMSRAQSEPAAQGQGPAPILSGPPKSHGTPGPPAVPSVPTAHTAGPDGMLSVRVPWGDVELICAYFCADAFLRAS